MKTTLIEIPVTYPETVLCRGIRVNKKWVRATAVDTDKKIKLPLADVLYFGKNKSGASVICYNRKTQWQLQGTAEVMSNGFVKINSTNGVYYTKKGK